MVQIKTSKTGKKYIKIGKKKTYLSTLLKRANKKRIDIGKKPYKSIGQRNIENILILLMKKGKVEIKSAKVKRRRGKKGKKIPPIRTKLEKKVAELEAQLKKERDEKEKAQLRNTIRETLEAIKAQTNLLELKKEEIKEEKSKKKRGRPRKIKTGVKIEEVIDDADDEKMTREDIKKQKEQQKEFEKRMKREEKKKIKEEKEGRKEKAKTQKELERVKKKKPITEDQIDRATRRLEKEEQELKELAEKGELSDEELAKLVKEQTTTAPITEEIMKKLFLGGMLLDKDKALDNTEIEKIMNRYQNFYGVYPRDQLYRIVPQVKEKSNGGVILNLDKSGEPGSHWVALYWDAKNDKPSIEYFDSYARSPPMEIERDIKNIVNKLQADKHLKYKENGIINQSKSSVSCGYIAMKFLMDRFRGIPFKKATGYGVNKSEENAENMEKHFRYLI